MATNTFFESYIDETLEIIKPFATILGLRLFKNDGIIHKYYFYSIFTIIMINTDLRSADVWMLTEGRKKENIIYLSYNAPCLAISNMSVFKMISFIWYNKKIQLVFNTLRGLEQEENRCIRDRKRVTYSYMKIETSKINLLTKIMCAVNLCVLAAFLLMPLAIMGYRYVATGDYQRVLPLFVVYPFDVLHPWVWPFVYMKQCWTGSNIIMGLCVSDCCLYICASYIVMQFNLLGRVIEELVTRPHYDPGYDPEVMKRKCHYIIQWHQKILICVKTLEEIFNKSTLLNVITASGTICLCGFNIVNMDDLFYTASFGFIFFMALLQVFLLCYFGDNLMNSSIAVSDAVYNCRWYMADRKTTRTLLLILIRTQKECKLSAYGFADINLQTFTSILKTSWSYFALLNTVYSSNES